ncbi:MAG: sugar MFS transporter [Chthoniobacteraceae bacterium]
MNSPITLPEQPVGNGVSNGTQRFAISIVTTIFFMWGFITCLNDILIPHLKAVFALNYFQSSLVQFTFFGAYFIISLPAGKLVSVLGYQRGMVAGLSTCGVGALLFYPAAAFLSYPFFLGAFFILASGITILQVAANAYVSVLGKPETASSRLNLAQAFNSLGTTLAPFFGSYLILAGSGGLQSKVEQASMVKLPYIGIALTLIVMAAVAGLLKLPSIPAVEGDEAHSFSEVLKVRHLVLAAVGIFLYVGAEVSIGSYLINFLAEPAIAGMVAEKAAHYVAFYWGAAMLGRFIGSALLQKFRAEHLLSIFSGIAASLLVIAVLGHGHVAMWAILSVGFFNSILFPNLFTLGLNGLGHLTSRGSSFLIMAIVGGALLPVVTGRAADLIGIHLSMCIPAVCYVYIVFYGISGWKMER